MIPDAAFRNKHGIFRCIRSQLCYGVQIHFKGFQIPVVDAQDLRLEECHAFQFLPVVYLHQNFQPQRIRQAVQFRQTLRRQDCGDQQGGICAIIDAEHAFDRFYAAKLGVDVDNLLISQPDNGEQALEIAEQLIRSSAIDIIVVDSVAALTPKAEIEGDMGDNKVGLQARLMSQALRKLTSAVSKTRTTCIFINQLREKIGVMFGNPETTTGGNALKFYASVRLDIRGGQAIKNGEEVIGKQTKVKVVKNKVAPPFRRAEFDIMFGEGISRAGEIIDLGAELGIIKKSGSWFSYNDTKIAQGRDAAKQVILDNPELAEELEGLIFEELKKEK